jgi:uncharacterized delta-60 repeat protein
MPSNDAGVDAGGTETDAGSDAGTDAGVVQRDLDVAVVKLTRAGALDTTFGTGGKAIVDFGQATGGARDTAYGFDVDAMGRVVLFGSTRSQTATDVDRYVARLTTAGALDVTFGTGGVVRLDLGGTSDAARHGAVQADGKILASGYTSLPTGATQSDGGMQSANSIVLQRLDATGAPDVTFGTGGLVKLNPFPPAGTATLWGMCEAYAAVQQSSGRYVTGGYGRVAASGPVDLASVRLNADGTRDTTWNTTGAITLDLVGADERARHLSVLPDDRVVFAGSGTPLTGNIDALVHVTNADGTPDTTFGTGGTKLFAFGRNDEAFWSSAVGPGAMSIAVAGYRVGSANTATENDDALLAIIPLSVGAPAEFAQPVPLSDSAHDRFFGVAWDGMQVVAAGFVREGSDTQFAVARFNQDGTRDTTFGTNGVVKVNVTVGGGTEEVARWVKVLADGSIFLAGPAEH